MKKIRSDLESGKNTSVCLLNYKKSGEPFYNQLFITGLVDETGAF